MRGIPEHNYPAFKEAKDRLSRAGWDITSPAELHLETDLPQATYVSTDVNALLQQQAIILLPGWEKSIGARAEKAIAEWLELEVLYYWEEELTGGTKVWLHDNPEEPPADDFDDFMASLGEVRITDPKTGGQKGTKPQRMDLLPFDALMEVSRHYAAGAEKYEDRNWERGYDWHLAAAAMLRHFALWWQGEELDEEGLHHLNAVVFHALTLRTFELRGLGTDDRPGWGS
jgi:hypothetical protein